MRSPRLAATVVLALLHAVGYLALSVGCVVLLVGTATTSVVVDRGEQLEDLVQGALLALSFAALVAVSGWGAVASTRGGGVWQLVVAGGPSAVGGVGYALAVAAESNDPGVVHRDDVLALTILVTVGLLGVALVVLALRGRTAAAQAAVRRVTRTG